jgi:hypothetical protein
MFRQPIPSSQALFGMGAGMRLAIAAVVIAAIAVPLISLGNTVSGINIPSVTPGVAPGIATPTVPVAASRTGKPVSYLTAAGLRAGLRLISKRLPGARLDQLRLAARSLIASVRLPGGAFKEVVLEPSGTLVTSGASTGERLLSLAQISPRAVARIVSGMRDRFRVPAGQIDYMVTAPSFAGTRWVVFAERPGHPGFTATLAGTHLRRLPG